MTIIVFMTVYSSSALLLWVSMRTLAFSVQYSIEGMHVLSGLFEDQGWIRNDIVTVGSCIHAISLQLSARRMQVSIVMKA